MRRIIALILGSLTVTVATAACNAGNTLSGASSPTVIPSTLPDGIGAGASAAPSPTMTAIATSPSYAPVASPAPAVTDVVRRPGY